ncbi:hypothetical protein [Mesorhizobium sp. LjRoot246]|uniref:hypothetical protein n=1 Tax=Mesorhizobium sp. LjRoot246 TaxID=3342294 RepID=UPI003ECE2A56
MMAKAPDKIAVAFAKVRSEWNRAEKAIKLAEQVNKEIVNPAIYELRYGARRVVEAFDLDDPTAAEKHLQDAYFDCCRARHDAIDAATSKMTAVMDLAVQKLGADVVLQYFPEFTALVHRLGAVCDLIAESREDRKNRDKIYAVIEADDLGELVKIYNKFKASEPLLKAAAAKIRREIFFTRLFGWASIAAGIGAIIAAWWWH